MSTSMMTIYLVPVGATDLSKKGELLGINNPELNGAGKSNADRAAGILAPIVLEAVFSGPYRRESETAELVARTHSIPVRVEKDLKDINYGRWCGQTWQAIETNEGDALSKLVKSPHRFRFPSGDKMKRSGKRLQSFVRQLLANYGTGNLVVIADDFVLMVIVSMMTKVEFRELDPLKPSLGKMTVVECDQGKCSIKHLRSK